MYNHISKLLRDYVFTAFVCLVKLIKVTVLSGSKFAFFTLAQAISPLAGKIGGNSTLLCLIAFRAIAFAATGKIALASCSLFYMLSVFGFPTIFGSLYLTSNSKALRVIIPLACMFLFIVHPIGYESAIYSLYWLVPTIIGLGLFKTDYFFINALGATFTQHAVGSVIWLYTRNIPAQVWTNLVTVVWAERLLFAIIMTVSYYAYLYCCHKIKAIQNSSSSSISVAAN